MTLWTVQHAKTLIPELIIFAIVALLVGFLLKNKSESVKRIPLMIIAVALLILEIKKQILSVTDGVYNTYALPFHYCSLFIYLLPVHAFYRGKHKEIVSAITFALSSSLFLFMLIMPEIVYSYARIDTLFSDFVSFHTVAFHGLVCLYFMLMSTLGLAWTQRERDVKAIAIFLAAFEIVAFAMAQLLKTNFHNLYRCDVEFLESIRQAVMSSIGFWTYPLHLLVNTVLTVSFTLLCYLVFGLAYKKIKK